MDISFFKYTQKHRYRDLSPNTPDHHGGGSK